MVKALSQCESPLRISDPRNAELNQAYLQYKKDGVLLRAGRQRIIRNSAAFIGNVGWRQNEQTFDAVHLGYTGEDFEISYAYSDRAQRIFGEEASGALNEFEGDFHFIDGNYNADFGKVGGYVYLIDVENNGNVGESNSFGVFGNFGPLYAEFAYQEGEGNLSEGDYDAVYGHVKFTHKIDKTTLLLGAEYLSEDFKTPFATVHAFNGFADAFILQRIGLNENSNFEGITDIYAGITQAGLPGGLTFKGFLHYYANDSLDETYGYEVDAVLVKKFNKNFTGLLKAAYFVADDGGDFSDITQVTVDLTYTF